MSAFFVFFFQAEDGIRDVAVTGVQTCALPISFILAGAVNTAIVGSNGVLNRVSEDGVLSEWFRQPHKRFGTSYRIINTVVGLQIITIIISHGDVTFLANLYAFGDRKSTRLNSSH